MLLCGQGIQSRRGGLTGEEKNMMFNYGCTELYINGGERESDIQGVMVGMKPGDTDMEAAIV